MAEDMVERAVKAMLAADYSMENMARAALLAALDIEDSATIDAAAAGIMEAEGTPWGVSRNYARAAIAALKKHAQGETR